MSSGLGYFFGFLLFAGIFAAVLVPSLVVSSGPCVRLSEETSFHVPSESAALSHMETVCPCRPPAEWHFGTNERELSNQYFNQHPGQLIDDPRGLSSLAIFFGQFVDHTIVRSREVTDEPAIVVPFNAEINQTIQRVAFQPAAINSQCREPKNQMSPLLDASSVYGDYVEPDRLDHLRASPGSCRLKTSSGYEGETLPPIIDGSYYCGDVRCPENAVLLGIHTLWLREHNRLCAILETSPGSRDWTENQRFYKARDLVIWKMQKIIYEEWLPAVYGDQFHLLQTVPTKGHGVRLTTEFTGAAYRWHSAIPNRVGDHLLKDLFDGSALIHSKGVDSLVHAAQGQLASRADHKVVDALRNFLFGPFGKDLMVNNLVRAREIGLGTYQQLCQCFGVEPQVAYEDPLHGMLSEPLLEGSSLPRLMAHICAEQFQRLRVNDPNHYANHRHQLGPLLRVELDSTTMASLLNNHMGGQYPLNKNVFFV